MIALEEYKLANQSRYKVHMIDDNGKECHCRDIVFPLIEVEGESDERYFMLYNDQWEPISEVFRYINIELKGRPLSSRRKIAHSLRLLYVYLSFVNKPLTDITRNVRDGLKRFLKGILPGTHEYHLITQRTNATVNAYLSYYRQYLDFMDISCKSLSRVRSVTVNTYAQGDFTMSQEVMRYESNYSVNPHKEDFLPAFISPKEFAKLWEIARRHDDSTALFMMYLMYCHGLRRGECLGITVEDLKTIYCDGKDIPVIILRNRASDRDDQKAKNRLAAETSLIYNDADYISQYKKDPYSRICLVENDEFYHQLLEYVELSSENAILNHYENYRDAVADIVEKDFGTRTGLDENHYIFLNNKGRRLTLINRSYVILYISPQGR